MDATITRLVETRNLITRLWNDAAQRNVTPSIYYDSVTDIVLLLIVDRKVSRVVHYLDEHVALLYHPDSKEIIGLQIEAFEKGFLPLYGELQKTWRLSDNCKDLHNLGDMVITVRKQEEVMARQITRIAVPVAAKAGMKLPAFA